MTANELVDELKKISLIADNHTKIVLSIAETKLRQKQLQIDQLLETQDYLFKRHDEQQAEIEALKTENKVLRKGELWLGMVYNNRGNGIAPMYLENFMRFCEKNGFTEESGYKLFKAQEK